MNKYLLQKQQYLQKQNIPKPIISNIVKIYTKEYNLKIAFWDNSLSERGTTVALYDYAYHNKYLLNNQSIILYDHTRTNNNQNVINKFKKEFDVFSVNNFKEVDNILKHQNCDN
jgi:c-di-AMP phosphodiesterase-like protein